jgi:hypothetical protein
MKKSVTRLLLGITLLPAVLAQAQWLTNPGFESELEGWTVKELTPVSSASAEAAHEGKFGLRLTDEITDNGANISTERFSVTPGQKVTLGFLARSPGGSIAAVMIVPYSSNNKPLMNEQGRPPVTIGIKESSDWVHYDAEYTVPDEATSVALSIRTWTGPTGIVDLDDFNLEIE